MRIPVTIYNHQLPFTSPAFDWEHRSPWQRNKFEDLSSKYNVPSIIARKLKQLRFMNMKKLLKLTRIWLHLAKIFSLKLDF